MDDSDLPTDVLTVEQLADNQDAELKRLLGLLKELADILHENSVLDAKRRGALDQIKPGKLDVEDLYVAFDELTSIFKKYDIANEDWKSGYLAQLNKITVVDKAEQLRAAEVRVSDPKAENAKLLEKNQELEAGIPAEVQRRVQQEKKEKIDDAQRKVENMIGFLKTNKHEADSNKGSLSVLWAQVEKADAEKARAVAAAEAPLYEKIGALEQEVGNLKVKIQEDQTQSEQSEQHESSGGKRESSEEDREAADESAKSQLRVNTESASKEVPKHAEAAAEERYKRLLKETLDTLAAARAGVDSRQQQLEADRQRHHSTTYIFRGARANSRMPQEHCGWPPHSQRFRRGHQAVISHGNVDAAESAGAK